MDELRNGLELATEDELRHLTQILFSRKFNPLDYWRTPEPLDVQSQTWENWLSSIEQRFRFLGADGVTVLKGKAQYVSYRQILIQVCRYLKIQYSHSMDTLDIEAEIFLHLIGKAWKKLPKSEQHSITLEVQKALSKSPSPEPLPLHIQHDPVKILATGGGAIAISSLAKTFILQQIAQQFALHFASYQMAKSALLRGGMMATAEWQNYVLLQTAKEGMATSVAKYSLARTAFTVFSSLLWVGLIADLGWRTIATNYGRIIPTIFTLAQIRLLRATAWQYS